MSVGRLWRGATLIRSFVNSPAPFSQAIRSTTTYRQGYEAPGIVQPKPSKKPLSGYIRFIAQVKDDMKKENPKLKPTEIMDWIEDRWNKMDSVNREKYAAEARQELAGGADTKPPTIDFTADILPDKLFKTIEVELLGYEPTVLGSYQWYILTAASHLGIEVGRVWEPKVSDKFRFSLLKSVHIFKKHQVQYEVRTYHKFFTFHKLTGSTASTYLEYIQRNIPEGVAMKVTKVEVLPHPDFLQK